MLISLGHVPRGNRSPSFKDIEGKELVNDVSEGDIIRYLDLM